MSETDTPWMEVAHVVEPLRMHPAAIAQQNDHFRQSCLAGNVAKVGKLCRSYPDLVKRKLDRCGSNFGDEGTGLHLAASEGHVECCRVLLRAGADTEATDGFGRTPLTYATDCDVLKLLLSHGANVRAVEWRGWTALHFCALENWGTRAVQLLLSAGADKNATNDPGDTPLTLAMDAGNTETAMQLASLGGKGGKRKLCDSETALLHVIARQCFEVDAASLIRKLVNAGGDMEAVDGMQRTPLLTAASHNNAVVCRSLLELGANVSVKDKDGATPLRVASDEKLLNILLAWTIEKGADISDDSMQNIQPVFMAAAECGCGRAVRMLAQAGANLEERDPDKDGSTALLVASKNGSVCAAQALIDAGADIHACNRRGNTPLLLAVKNGFTDLAMKLIEAGASVHSINKCGETALSLALINGHGKICCQLINGGAKVDGRISFFPCLKNAVVAGDIGLLTRLVQAGASVNERGDDGTTVLHVAVCHRLDMVKFLLIHGADVSAPAENGFMPLHSACAANTQAYQQVDVIKTLLAYGAVPTAETNDHETPLDIAQQRHRRFAVAVLKKAELAHQLIEAGGKATKPSSSHTSLWRASGCWEVDAHKSSPSHVPWKLCPGRKPGRRRRGKHAA